MKCRYKEEMDYFYLTKNNYRDFLDRVYEDKYRVEEYENYIKVFKWNSCEYSYSFYFNQYYVYEFGDYYCEWFSYSKKKFEEKFEIIGDEQYENRL